MPGADRIYRLCLGVGRIWHEGHGQPSHRCHMQQHRLHHLQNRAERVWQDKPLQERRYVEVFKSAGGSA